MRTRTVMIESRDGTLQLIPFSERGSAYESQIPERRYPMAPLVMGIILGTLLDVNLRRGLALSDGDLTPFFTRPVSAVICTLVVLSVLLSIPVVKRRVTSLFTKIGKAATGRS